MNVLIDDGGRARICDFGLVRILSDESTGLVTTTTHTGTVRYLAYELVVSEQPVPTVASDVHALGCIGLDVSRASFLY
jgi:serine/threonine protein kinase